MQCKKTPQKTGEKLFDNDEIWPKEMHLNPETE